MTDLIAWTGWLNTTCPHDQSPLRYGHLENTDGDYKGEYVTCCARFHVWEENAGDEVPEGTAFGIGSLVRIKGESPIGTVTAIDYPRHPVYNDRPTFHVQFDDRMAQLDIFQIELNDSTTTGL